MLERTFIHSQGIGPATERKLWSSGYATWDDCLARPGSLPLGPTARAHLITTLSESRQALAAGDYAYFAGRLASGEHWRAIRSFRRIGFLDIETDGTDRVTVIGLYDGVRVRQYVRGDNLEVFPEEVSAFEALVTFFGSGFDIPVLRRVFPSVPFNQIHCDLCFALKRLGHRGGLKAIEKQFGIARRPDLEGLGGWDAVRLWQQHLAGHEQSLATLLAYNAEDVVNLEPLLNFAYESLRVKVLGR